MILKPGDLAVAREALFIEPGWTLEEQRHNGRSLAVFTRK